jgi:hypothetical protein
VSGVGKYDFQIISKPSEHIFDSSKSSSVAPVVFRQKAAGILARAFEKF